MRRIRRTIGQQSSNDRIMRAEERLKMSISMLQFEANTLWQIFNAFFIGNSILATSIFVLLSSNQSTYYGLFIGISLAGIILTILWYKTFCRNSSWYAFRMRQSKRDETEYTRLINNTEWYLVNKDAENFAENQVVEEKKIEGWKNNEAAKLMILVYGIVYLSILSWALIKILCPHQV